MRKSNRNSLPGLCSSLDEGVRVKTKIIDLLSAFDPVVHDRLITKIAASGGDSSVVVWVSDFPLCCRRAII
jgi:hypothetical protein